MFVGVSDAAVMLFFEIVVRKVGIAAAAKPKLLDELLALFVGSQLEKGVAFVRGNNVGDVLGKPLLVGVIELLQGALHLALRVFIHFLGNRRRTGILRLLGKSGRQADGECKNGCDYGTRYP